MKTSIITTLGTWLITLGLTTGVLLAGDRKGEASAYSSDDSGKRKKSVKFKSFKAADENKDGELTFEEFSKMKRLARIDDEKKHALFDFLDKNKDGALHIRELRPREPKWLAPMRKNFSKLDIDHSDSLNLEEFSAAAPLVRRQKNKVLLLFTKLDRNKNNVIERAELKWPSGLRRWQRIDFSKYDVNRSGGLDVIEYSKLPWMDKWPEDRRKNFFQRVDSNKDGEISPSEVRAARKKRRHRTPM